ncbi:hypothetical protein HYFRA_00012609 [Hymenoscyphus fraxineus]|uniref:Uncharacterized protein n=1 Tax=Hymenoscyphus fraxineus TaxID=746836 RepID=A0A9N9L657_9HELO|nr:hypothetical protein HYFRA_00012609 [Hymenoscyphus fraxineus]
MDESWTSVTRNPSAFRLLAFLIERWPRTAHEGPSNEPPRPNRTTRTLFTQPPFFPTMWACKPVCTYSPSSLFGLLGLQGVSQSVSQPGLSEADVQVGGRKSFPSIHPSIHPSKIALGASQLVNTPTSPAAQLNSLVPTLLQIGLPTMQAFHLFSFMNLDQGPPILTCDTATSNRTNAPSIHNITLHPSAFPLFQNEHEGNQFLEI